jgi:outer membrane lipoprotein-sorting protein
MKQRTWALLGLVLVLCLALAGCGNRITAEEIIAKIQETAQNTDDAHAVVVANVDVQGIEMTLTAEVWEKAPNMMRAQVLEATESQFTDVLMISDGQQAWVYEPARNRVQVGPAGELDMPLPQEMISSLQEAIQEVLDGSDVELAGEEEVVGREAYKLVVSPREDTGQELFPGNGTATLWVDKEQWFILKAMYAADTFGRGDMEVQSFELNPGLPDDLFHFEVPEGAAVIDVEAQKPQPLTLDEAKAQAGFPLLVPEYVPEGVTLIELFKSADSFILRYDHSAQVSFAIVQGPELAGPPPLGDTQDVTVRGQSATAITDEAGGNTYLYWTENGVTVTVAGHISLDEALQVAESLK